ncbi:MAG: hypothetical protein JWN23_2632 [Rhodocyclales bacterium]|nr:hypothetical protein [Rhodocyclales bacterium]
MSIDELLKTAKETLAERISSPLTGSFAVAWCLWNYKFLVILLSTAGVSQTFRLIDTVAFPDTRSLILRGMLYPVFSALVYVFGYPYPARIAYAFTLKRRREANQSKQQIEEETLLTLQQSRALRTEYFERERKFEGNIDRLNSEITRLTNALDLAQKEALGMQGREPSEKSDEALDMAQRGLLAYLDGRGGRVTEKEFLKGSAEPKVKVEFDIGELQKRKLITRKFSEGGDGYIFEFTHEGRRALLNGGKLAP